MTMAFSQLAERYFSRDYAQARQRFLEAARARAAHIESFPLEVRGATG